MRKLLGLILISIIGFNLGLTVLSQSDCDVTTTSPIEQANQLLDCQDIEGAIAVLTTALSETDDAIETASLQMALGNAHYVNENFFDAQVQYERAFITFNANDMRLEAGQAYLGAGLAKVGRRQIGEATNYFNEAIRRAEEMDDTLTLAQVYIALADIDFNERDYDNALTNISTALDYYNALNDPQGTLIVQQRQIDIYIAQGNIVDAFATLEDSISLAREIGAYDELAPMLLQLARARIINGQYTNAIDLLSEAESIYTAADNTIGQIEILIELGRVYTFQSDFPTANRTLRRAESLSTRAPIPCPLEMRVNTVRGEYFNATGQYQRAQDYFEQSFASPCATDELGLLARAQLGMGKAWFERGYTIFGGDEYQFALRNFREVNDPVGEVDSLIRLSEYFLRRRRISDATDYGFTASSLALESGNFNGAIRAEIALSNIEISHGAYDQSLERLESALALAIDSDNVAMQALTLQQIADLYFTLARYDDATRFWDRAQELYGSENNVSFDAQREFNRGLLLEASGDIAQALIAYQNSRELFAGIDDREGMIRVDLTLGGLYQDLALYEQAEPYYMSALRAAERTENTQFLADALTELGSLGLQRIDFAEQQGAPLSPQREATILDRAEERFFDALEIYIILEDRNGQAQVLNQLGLFGVRRLIPVQFGTGGFFQTALELSRETGDIVLEADVLSNLGYYNEVIGQAGTALNYYQQSLRMSDTINPALATRIRIRMAQIYERRGEFFNATSFYREAIDSLESLYILLGSSADQTEFGSQLNNLLPYERMIRYYGLNIVDGRQRDAATALNYIERSRARSLLFQLSGEDLQFSQSNSANLSDWQRTREQLLDLYERLDEAREQNLDTEALETEITTLETALSEFQQDEEIESLLQVFTINTVDLQELQATLADDTAMLVYHISPETYDEFRTEAGRVFTFVITSNSIIQQPTLIESYQDNIVNPINVFRRNPRNTQSLESLYNILIDPIRSEIDGYENLVVVPHDVLNYLPYEALIDETGSSLVENFNISYSSSATTYYLLEQRNQAGTEGDSVILSHGDDLFYAKEEATIVADSLGVDALNDDIATETALREAAANASVIHVAAHGEFNPQQALDSYLRLAGDSQNDGQLTVREIYTLDLQTHNPLVVLSACNTAVSQINPGDEFQNMTRAFLLTGARGVVASLWAVDDVATSELMVAFYNNRQAGMSDAEALADAKRTIREQFPNPYFWAGFILVGAD